VLNSAGGIVEEMNFDAWGNRRNPSTWSYTNIPTQYVFDRGYTMHEHLEEFKLINMNGRVYDPAIARFLSPDPVLQMPEYSQNFNRYSYVLNNPLKYTVPSGFVIEGDEEDKKGFQPQLPSWLERMRTISNSIAEEWNEFASNVKENSMSTCESLFGKSISGFMEDHKIESEEESKGLFDSFAGAFFYGDGDVLNILDSPTRKYQIDSYEVQNFRKFDIFNFTSPKNPNPIGYPPSETGWDTMIGNSENGASCKTEWSQDSIYYLEYTKDGKTDGVEWFYPWDDNYDPKYLPK